MTFQEMEEPCRHVFAIYGKVPFLPRPPFAESYYDLVGYWYYTSTHVEMYKSVAIIPDMRNLTIDTSIAPPREKVRHMGKSRKGRIGRVTGTFLLTEDVESCYDASKPMDSRMSNSLLQDLVKEDHAAAARLCRMMNRRRVGDLCLGGGNQNTTITLPNRPVGAPTRKRFESSGMHC